VTESRRGSKKMVREPAACPQHPESRTETGFRNNENPNLSVCFSPLWRKGSSHLRVPVAPLNFSRYVSAIVRSKRSADPVYIMLSSQEHDPLLTLWESRHKTPHSNCQDRSSVDCTSLVKTRQTPPVHAEEEREKTVLDPCHSCQKATWKGHSRVCA